MTNDSANLTIWLGAGGDNPGLYLYNLSDQQLEGIALFPAGQSVYSIARSPGGDTYIAGTRDGLLHQFVSNTEADGKPEHSAEHLQGAGVLSICFLDRFRFAVADTAGRCLLWEMGSTQPRKLCTRGNTICSLAKVSSTLLAGLSTQGVLLSWDLMTGELIEVIEAPAPAPLGSLVRLMYWSEASSLVWPGVAGQLVFCRTEDRSIHTIRAHPGGVYAVTECEANLFSIGFQDGCLKCWQADSDAPVAIVEAPEGTVSAYVWKNRKRQVLLINKIGQAGVYEFLGEKLKLTIGLGGRDYRVCFGPEASKLQSVLEQRRSAEAREIAAQIKEKLKRGDSDGIDDLHRELFESGFEHVSLVLKAEAARVTDDVISELQAYKKLADLIPAGHEGSKDSLTRYAKLLERLWQLCPAHDLYAHLAMMCPSDPDYSRNARRLAEYLHILDEGEYVIEPDVPFTVLIRAAMIMNRPFYGRYLVNSLDTHATNCADISPAALVDKYEQVRESNPEISLPRAKAKMLSWASRDRIEHVDTVVFGGDDSGRIDGLELGLKFVSTGLQTLLVPVVLFKARVAGSEKDIKKHNESIMDMLRQVDEDKSRSNGWLRVVHRHANQAIRQLITKQLARNGAALMGR